MKHVLKFIVRLFTVFILFLFLDKGSTLAAGATMYLSPATGSYDSGEEFTVDIMIDSGGDDVQTARAAISYDSDVVQVKAVSHSNIFCQFPDSGYEVDNTNGQMILTGFCQDEHYATVGDADILGRITFDAVGGGTANVEFNFDGTDDADMTYMLEPGSPPQQLDMTEPTGATFTISGSATGGGDDLPDTGIRVNVGITFGVSLVLLSLFVLVADAVLPPVLKWFSQRGQRTIVV
ncbi:MAG: cohesin domain-containing protein [bacterium]